MRFEGSGGAAKVGCGHCGEVLGELSGRWQDLAGTVRLGAEDLGDDRSVHGDLEALQHVCPRCGASLWVDVSDRDSEAMWRDFVIPADPGAGLPGSRENDG